MSPMLLKAETGEGFSISVHVRLAMSTKLARHPKIRPVTENKFSVSVDIV